jgi:hypothetical protein
LFQPEWKLSKVQNAKGHFANSEMGFRLATSVKRSALQAAARGAGVIRKKLDVGSWANVSERSFPFV